ncbi:MAG: type II secretion system F family protein [Chloroflexota bacterium]|nr:type II secretion system F family protein [Chloroflexota bacterium]
MGGGIRRRLLGAGEADEEALLALGHALLQPHRGLEQTVREVARRSGGVVGEELEWLNRWMSYGGHDLIDGLEAMAERNGVPEFSSIVGQLRAGHEQGIPLVQTLSSQAETLRERQRVRLLELGSQASTKMLIPIVLFMAPALFIVEVGPAAMSILHATGGQAEPAAFASGDPTHGRRAGRHRGQCDGL